MHVLSIPSVRGCAGVLHARPRSAARKGGRGVVEKAFATADGGLLLGSAEVDRPDNNQGFRIDDGDVVTQAIGHVKVSAVPGQGHGLRAGRHLASNETWRKVETVGQKGIVQRENVIEWLNPSGGGTKTPRRSVSDDSVANP